MSRYIAWIKKHRLLYYILLGIKNRKNDAFFKGVELKDCFQFHSNGDKHYGQSIYYIGISGGESGFFAIYRFVLDALYVADMTGMIPYIDITKTKYNVSDDESDNLFNYYFTQPSNVRKEDLSQAMAVFEYTMEHRRWLEDIYSPKKSLLAGYEVDDKIIEILAQMSKKYIMLNPKTKDMLQKDIVELLSGEKVVAVHFRGNAFNVGFAGHPIALTVEDYFEYIDECLELGFTKVFVATDDEIALETFKEKYPENIVYYSDTIRSSDGIDVHDQYKEKQNGYILGYQVLRDVHTIRKCDALICGKSQVSFAARIEKRVEEKTFDYLKVIDKGMHGDTNSKRANQYIRDIHLRKKYQKG